MSDDAVTYDEVLPERATAQTAGGEPIGWARGPRPCPGAPDGRIDAGLHVARCACDGSGTIPGDTIEVPCLCAEHRAQHLGGWKVNTAMCPNRGGTLRVRLTEDPLPIYKDPMCPPGKAYLLTEPASRTVELAATLVGWRHVGTVVK